jgi:hypothetical protein
MVEGGSKKVGVASVLMIAGMAMLIGIAVGVGGGALFPTESSSPLPAHGELASEAEVVDEPVDNVVDTPSWVPDGFKQLDDSVAVRPVPSSEGWVCKKTGDGVCMRVEVATAETCKARVDMVTLDESNRIVDDVWEVTDVPSGTIGFVEFSLSSQDKWISFNIFDADCYYSVE